MNQRRWGLPLGGIKSSLEIVCFQVAPEKVKCTSWTDRVRKGIPNRWCSCTEGARTESKVNARDLQEVRRKRWPENTGWAVGSKKTSEIRWNFIMCGLESERGKLKFDAPLNWQPVEFSKCVDRRQIRWLLCYNSCCCVLDPLQTSDIFSRWTK